VAVGIGAAFAWNGKVWSKVPLPRQVPADSEFGAVACAGPADCMAVGFTGSAVPLAMRWNGVRWHRVASAGIACFAGQCGISGHGRGRYVVVGDNLSSFWNGRSWHRIALPAANVLVPGVSCTESFCLAVGRSVGNSSEFAWNGKKWHTLPRTGFDNESVWCTRPTACMDVGFGGVSSWNGRRWTRLRLSVINRFTGVSCTRPGNCIAVGPTNNLALERDWLAERWNGSRWQVIPGPAKTDGGPAEQISCTSMRFCMALSTFAFDPAAQWWNGRRWIATDLPFQSPPGTFGIEGLSCSSPSKCVAVGGNVAWNWNGTSWPESNPEIGGPNVDLQSVSCLSATLCMATGFVYTGDCQDTCTMTGLAEQWNGSSWSVSDSTILGSSTLDHLPSSQISCPAATFCMEETTGVGPVSVRSWDGHSWTQQTVPFSTASGISCGGTSSCVVISTFIRGGELADTTEIWNGTSWRAAKPAPGGLLTALSCSRPDRCTAAGGTAGNLAMTQTWDGTSWKLTHPANP
jgi:hypothetical protein